MILSQVRHTQRQWAERAGITVDAQGYTLTLNANLLQPLHRDTRRDFEQGDGSELGTAGRRGKMQALHSSSCLAVNFFDYWRGRAQQPLQFALQLTLAIRDLRFEAKYPTGIGPRSPNLDVIISLGDGAELAVESKFLEPYRAKRGPSLARKYFPGSQRLWQDAGLPRCQELAEGGYAAYTSLDVPQLLKHMLGLARSRSCRALLYIWYDVGGKPGRDHARQVQQLVAHIAADGIRFSALSYQDLYHGLAEHCGTEHARYLRYLRGRYIETAA